MPRNRPLKIDGDTLDKLKQLKRELSVLEKRDIAMGEIIQRMVKGDDIPERLRLGAIERRRVLK